MNETSAPKKPHIARTASLASIGMIFIIYVFMQTLGYIRDNAILGISDLSDLPAYVAKFLAMYVIPPSIIFGLIMYFYARPLDRALARLRAGDALDPATTEKIRLKMLRFSYLVLALNVLGFALGYVIFVIAVEGLAGFASLHNMIILVSNCTGAIMYASAQTAFHGVVFAELRDRLGVTEIGRRRRSMRSSIRQVGQVAAVAVYVLTYMQFNAHPLYELRTLTFDSVVSAGGTGPAAAALYRERAPAIISGVLDRPGFRADSLPVPWEAGASFESREMAVFFLSAFFLAVVCVFAQAARSFESKDTIYALIARIRDVVDGEGDLTKRLSLRDTDEFGELGEAVNRLLERFRSVVERIVRASDETRDVAVSIDTVMRESESVTFAARDAASALSADIQRQAGETRSLTASLDALRAASVAVSEAVDSQRRFTDDTASAMEEMAANIRSVETMTSRSGQVAESLSARGHAGASLVAETAGAIGEIEKSAAKVLKVLGSLSKIAGDTNLLAMNAAIEAAHAGDSGAGFAVVADEVRSLASGAAKQTQTIKTLVSEMGDRVRRGVESSTSTAQSFDSLSEGIGEAAGIAREIAAAMREQSEGTQMVVNSVEQVVETSHSVRDRISAQERETQQMAGRFGEALERFATLSVRAGEQAEAMGRLEEAFLAVRREVDRNIEAVTELENELSGFRI